MHWQRTTHGPFEAWEGLSENLRAVVLPALGSRMVSLVHVPSGREWLEPGHGPADPGYGAPFPEGGLCGWDEMFPSIDPCRYPEDPWRGAEIPDHGEVWSIPWQAELRDGALHLRTHGVRFPYRLEKRLSFDGDGALLIHYRAENLSPFPFRFAWTAHPLFRVNPGTRIELPLPEGARYVITAAGPDRPAGKPPMNRSSGRFPAPGTPLRGWMWPLAETPDATPKSGSSTRFGKAGPGFRTPSPGRRSPSSFRRTASLTSRFGSTMAVTRTAGMSRRSRPPPSVTAWRTPSGRTAPPRCRPSAPPNGTCASGSMASGTRECLAHEDQPGRRSMKDRRFWP